MKKLEKIKKVMLTACSDDPQRAKMCGIFHDLDHCRLLATDGFIAMQYNTPHILSSEKGKSLRPTITREMKLYEALFKYNKSLNQYECGIGTQHFPNVDAVKPNIDDCFRIEINDADKIVKEFDDIFKKRNTGRIQAVSFGRTYITWANLRKMLNFMSLSGEKITFYLNEDPTKQSSFVSGDFYAVVTPMVGFGPFKRESFTFIRFPIDEIGKPKKEVEKTPKEGKASTKARANELTLQRDKEKPKTRKDMATKAKTKPKTKTSSAKAAAFNKEIERTAKAKKAGMKTKTASKYGIQTKLTERGVNSKKAATLREKMKADYQAILQAEIAKQNGKMTPEKLGKAGKAAGAIYRKKYGLSKTESGNKRWGKILKMAGK